MDFKIFLKHGIELVDVCAPPHQYVMRPQWQRTSHYILNH